MAGRDDQGGVRAQVLGEEPPNAVGVVGDAPGSAHNVKQVRRCERGVHGVSERFELGDGQRGDVPAAVAAAQPQRERALVVPAELVAIGRVEVDPVLAGQGPR